MSNKKTGKEQVQSMEDWYNKDAYDSDTDLPEADQEMIQKKTRWEGKAEADEARDAAWNNQGFFPKLKKAFKTGFYGAKKR